MNYYPHLWGKAATTGISYQSGTKGFAGSILDDTYGYQGSNPIQINSASVSFNLPENVVLPSSAPMNVQSQVAQWIGIQSGGHFQNVPYLTQAGVITTVKTKTTPGSSVLTQKLFFEYYPNPPMFENGFLSGPNDIVDIQLSISGVQSAMVGVYDQTSGRFITMDLPFSGQCGDASSPCNNGNRAEAIAEFKSFTLNGGLVNGTYLFNFGDLPFHEATAMNTSGTVFSFARYDSGPPPCTIFVDLADVDPWVHVMPSPDLVHTNTVGSDLLTTVTTSYTGPAGGQGY